jgi:hypothetical protein
MKKEDFIAKVVNELLNESFNIHLHQSHKVEDCGGWFDSDAKEFVVAMNNPMSFEIFVHEYCHFKQWKYTNDYFSRVNGGSGIFFNWISGTEYSSDIVDLSWRDTIDLELSCEKIAVETIKWNDLPIDIEKYKRAANAYLLFYQFVRVNRKWAKQSPYNNETILAAMPLELQPLEYYLDLNNVPENLKEEFEKCFIE